MWEPIERRFARATCLSRCSGLCQDFIGWLLQMALQQGDPTQKGKDTLPEKYCGRETNKTRPYGSGLIVQLLF